MSANVLVPFQPRLWLASHQIKWDPPTTYPGWAERPVPWTWLSPQGCLSSWTPSALTVLGHTEETTSTITAQKAPLGA